MAKELYVCAYPKSGVTWLIHLLSDILDSPQQDTLDGPIMYWGDGEDGDYIIRKVHSPYKPEFDDKEFVFLQRDPRDVAVSRWFFIRQKVSLSESMHSMWAARTEFQYPNWVGSWLKHRSNVIYTLYELLHSNPEKELSRICYSITRSPIPIEKIRQAIKNQSLKNMRLQVGEHFTRKGIVGDWRNHFTREVAKEFNKHIGRFMLEQKYIDGLEWWKEL